MSRGLTITRGSGNVFRDLGFLATGLSCVVAIILTGTAAAAPIQSGDVYVLDGDTVRIHDQRPNVRLVGFNAPETGARAKCDAERALGRKATGRVRDLVLQGKLDFEFVACACKPGTEG